MIKGVNELIAQVCPSAFIYMKKRSFDSLEVTKTCPLLTFKEGGAGEVEAAAVRC